MKILIAGAAIAAAIAFAAPASAQTDPQAPGVAGATNIGAANGMPDNGSSHNDTSVSAPPRPTPVHHRMHHRARTQAMPSTDTSAH